MDELNLYLSSNIKYLRQIRGKTQEDLAKICGKKNTAISNWENGIREPSAIDLAKLANYFNVSIDDLVINDLRKHQKENWKLKRLRAVTRSQNEKSQKSAKTKTKYQAI